MRLLPPIFILFSPQLIFLVRTQEPTSRGQVRSTETSSGSPDETETPFEPFGYVVNSEPCQSLSRGHQQCVDGCGVNTMCREYSMSTPDDKVKTGMTLPVCKCDNENSFNFNLKSHHCGFVNWTRVLTEDFGLTTTPRSTSCSSEEELAYQKCGLQCEVMLEEPNGDEGRYQGFLCFGQSSSSHRNSNRSNDKGFTCDCVKRGLTKVEPNVNTFGLEDACPYSRFSSSHVGQVNSRPEDTVTFHLYTNPKNKTEFEVLQLNDLAKLTKSRFKKQKPLKILIHGFRNGPGSQFPQNVKDAYLKEGAGNVLVVGWEELARLTQALVIGSYYKASVVNTPIVGRRVGQFVEFLVRARHTRLDLVHIVGHSLGAHVAGVSGDFLKGLFPGFPVARISGLDPAGPHFYRSRRAFRLNMGRPLLPNDASFVDIVHTDQFLYGRAGRVGTVDFIPNGGTLVQENCRQNISHILHDIFTLGSCSHAMAHILFTNSVGRWDIRACQCPSWTLFLQGKCRCARGSKNEAIFGEHCSPASKGNYFLQVKPCMQKDGAFCSSNN